VVVDKPIIVLHWSEGEGLATFPHTLVVADESSEVTVVDRFGSPEVGGAGHLVDAVVELVVGDNARLRYLSVQEHGPKTWQVALQRAHVGRDASLHSSAVALGGDYARLRSESLLGGDNAESDLMAVYFGDHTQMLDFRTLQDHDAPNTRSDLLFKGAVEDQAHSVYSGLIRLRPTARKSNASQTNRNLVLTEGAGAESIPNLEIEANDVRCSHASAVGPIDEDQLYYLESRGVPPAEAERLIVLGFFDDVLDRLPIPTLARALRRTVVEKVEHRRG
jgi:Fe-S cluster assembly protein SufD